MIDVCIEVGLFVCVMEVFVSYGGGYYVILLNDCV